MAAEVVWHQADWQWDPISMVAKPAESKARLATEQDSGISGGSSAAVEDKHRARGQVQVAVCQVRAARPGGRRAGGWLWGWGLRRAGAACRVWRVVPLAAGAGGPAQRQAAAHSPAPRPAARCRRCPAAPRT